MRRALLLLVAAVLLLGHAVPAPASAQAYRTDDEAWVVAAVNATRTGRGLSRLAVVPALVDLAREQSARMEARGAIFHNLQLKEGLTDLGLDWRWAGENVGVGGDVRVIQDAFLASPAHHDNIVRPDYNAIGVGVLSDGDGTGVYVTQVFAKLGSGVPQLPAAPTAAPTTPAPAAAVPTPAAEPGPAARGSPPTPAPTAVPTPMPLNALEGGHVRASTATHSAPRQAGPGIGMRAGDALRALIRSVLALIPFLD